jgi:predicted NodU family carbamoyl transferase
MTKILSLYTSHDGCVTYIVDNKIVFHTQIDRHNKYKHSSLPSKELTDFLYSLDFDVLLISQTPSHSTSEWYGIFEGSYKWYQKFKKFKIINFELSEHHLFHAYCALAWKKDIKNIVVCDGHGIKKNNFREQESIYKFENEILHHVNTESNNIGHHYSQSSFQIYDQYFTEGKLMAYSLHNDFARRKQKFFEEQMFKFISQYNLEYDFLFTGGCAQNVIFNNTLLNKFTKVFCDPFNGDFGISLGAANYFLKNSLKIESIYLGIPQDFNLDLFHNYKIIPTNYDEVANILQNEPVAIFQSRSEQGQRGLGNRSLLMSPIQNDSHEKLNQIKKREWYRPFACSILQEKAKEWFDMKGADESPYMMFVFEILFNKRNILKAGFAANQTSRIQTVKKSDNLHYYNLIKSFEKITNIPILVNTSLNLPGDVLVETFQDLKNMFQKSNLRYIYIPEIQKIICK